MNWTVEALLLLPLISLALLMIINKKVSSKENKWFLVFLCTAVIIIITDIVSEVIVLNSEKDIIILLIDGIIGFGLCPVCFYAMASIKLCRTKYTLLRKILLIPVGLIEVINIINIKYRIFYQVTLDGYVRKEFFYVQFAINAMFALIFIIMDLKEKKKGLMTDFISSLVVYALTLFAVLTQIIIKSVMVLWPSICLSILIYQISELLIEQRKDDLTSVYSRKIYDQELRINKNIAEIVIVDVNFFKTINDTWGHRYGDKVLVKIASLLVEEFGKYGYVCRIGGDEFALILKKDCSLVEEDAFNRIENSLLDIKEKNHCERVLAYGCSYIKKENFLSAVEAAEVSDVRMYKNKVIAKDVSINRKVSVNDFSDVTRIDI